ncbi:S1 family peptidase [Metabacillus endolithicus]|uniref:S1 family peptidase n=1 Tax=Metabacillus endolithicus TaxID=1535204 RepID=UPI001FFBCA04|nr:S1 family peptidase [Metabacillus endolithicus]UPG66185.1 hypothetical protein MVE64_26105 [Metabacillus endolithicus]
MFFSILLIQNTTVLAEGKSSKNTSETLIEEEDSFDEVSYGIKFRKEAGLDSSKEKVEKLIREHKINKDLYVEDFGTVLEKSEHDKLIKRIEKLDKLLPKVEAEFKSKQKSRYGGLYVNHQEDGAVYIGLKNGSSTELNNTKKLLKYENIKFFNVNYSEEDLMTAKDTLHSVKEKLTKNGVEITSVIPNIPLNRLDISVEQLNSETASIIQKFIGNIPIDLTDNFSQVVEADRYSGNEVIQGGLEIRNIDTGDGCTSAFTAYRNTSAGTLYYTLTAGHCATGLYQEFRHGTLKFGSVANHYNSSFLDAAAITLAPNRKTHYIFGEYSNSYEITGLKTSYYVGDFACMVGKTTAKTVCGSIGATSADLDTVRDVVSVNYYSQGGDSGGPVYNYGKAMGIHNGRYITGGYTLRYFAKIGKILDAFYMDGIVVK